MAVEWFLAPFSWVWSVLCGILLRPWAVALLIAVISIVYQAVRHHRNRARRSKPKSVPAVVTSPVSITEAILKELPVHPQNGWVLLKVSNSLRVFTRQLPVSSLPCTAASIVVEIPPKKALSLATSSKELIYWMEGVPSPPKQLRGDASGDIIKVELVIPPREEDDSVLVRMVSHVRRSLGVFMDKNHSGTVRELRDQITETLDRAWCEKDGQCYVLSLPKEPSTLPYHWSLLVFSPLKEKAISLATLVMLPRSQSICHHISSLITSRLCALREHVIMKKLKIYSANQPNDIGLMHSTALPPNQYVSSTSDQRTTSSEITVPNNVPRTIRQPTKQDKPAKQAFTKEESRHYKRQSQEHTQEKNSKQVDQPAPSQPTGKTISVTSSAPRRNFPDGLPQTVASVTSFDPTLVSLDEKYLSLTKQTGQLLISIANATEQDGWIPLSAKNDVSALKKPPAKGAPPINCVKGTGMVKAPPEFILRFLKDPSTTTKLDELLKESKTVHEVSGAVHIVHLLYKPVWPTSPREFSVMSVSGQFDKQTWVDAGISVQDPRIPQEKGYVRGELIVGGYVIRSVPDNPELSEVTYAAQVDLKGSIPAFVVNKITESQPQCVSRLRNHVEPLYAAMKSDGPQRLREFEETVKIGLISPELEQQPPSKESTIEDDAHLTAFPTLVPDKTPPNAVFNLTHPDATSDDVYPIPVVSDEPSPPKTVELEKGGGGGEEEEMWPNGQLDEDVLPEELHRVDFKVDLREDNAGFETPELGEEYENITLETVPSLETGTQAENGGSTTHLDGEGVIVMETLDTYTPLELSSAPDSEEGEGGVEGEERGVEGEERGEEGEEEQEKQRESEIEVKEEGEKEGEGEGVEKKGGEEEEEEIEEDEVFLTRRGPSLELKLPPYQRESVREDSKDSESDWSITKETINYPRSGSGLVDFRTLANQNAAKVLEELFFVSNLDLSNPSTFTDQSNGWSIVGVEKEVLILKKKSADSPFLSFMGKGIIKLPPQEVYDSLRNPQLGYTYDHMLKELHIVKQVEEGLYILHLHHETTQCFIKQSRDFCILVSERSEPKRKLLVGSSVEVPECPPNPNCFRGKIVYSGWVVEPRRFQGQMCTETTYIVQVDMGAVPATLVNFVSKRQPLAIAYLRDYLISTSLHISSKESSPS